MHRDSRSKNSRRNFLQKFAYSGVGVISAPLVVSSCKKEASSGDSKTLRVLTPDNKLLDIDSASIRPASDKKDQKYLQKLGIIDASVKSEDTNLKEKAEYENVQPGKAETIGPSFENAPPLFPHTTTGFFPIKMENNICFSCHLPDKVEKSGAVAIPASHFTDLRPKMHEVDGVLRFENEQEVYVEKLDSTNHAYFNCSQCHVPQTNVTADIENLFTPEFREEFGLEKSDLDKKIKEGVNP